MIDRDQIKERCLQTDCEMCPFSVEINDPFPFVMGCLLEDIVAEDEE